MDAIEYILHVGMGRSALATYWHGMGPEDKQALKEAVLQEILLGWQEEEAAVASGPSQMTSYRQFIERKAS